MTQPLSSADISIFLPEISKFWYIKKHRYRFNFNTLFLMLLTFFSLQSLFYKHGYIFDYDSKNDYSRSS